jgi:hypothetical protein
MTPYVFARVNELLRERRPTKCEVLTHAFIFQRCRVRYSTMCLYALLRIILLNRPMLRSSFGCTACLRCFWKEISHPSRPLACFRYPLCSPTPKGRLAYLFSADALRDTTLSCWNASALTSCVSCIAILSELTGLRLFVTV